LPGPVYQVKAIPITGAYFTAFNKDNHIQSLSTDTIMSFKAELERGNYFFVEISSTNTEILKAHLWTVQVEQDSKVFECKFAHPNKIIKEIDPREKESQYIYNYLLKDIIYTDVKSIDYKKPFTLRFQLHNNKSN